MERTLARFLKENPFDFDASQMERLQQDIKNPNKDQICDERVDYQFWLQGMKSRQEYFADYIERVFPCHKYPHLLEVGCGHNARLSYLLSLKGYQMSAIDPKLNNVDEQVEGIKEAFTYKKTVISKYDALVAQEPCEASEHIIRSCVKEKKNFIICLCAGIHPLMNGEIPTSIEEWYTKLQAIDPLHTTIFYSQFLPGYIVPIMFGYFESSHMERDSLIL